MAHGKSKSAGLKFVFMTAVVLLGFSVCVQEVFSYVMPKSHFLSWESERRPEQYKNMVKHAPPLRRFKVSRDRVAKLKKSSFWNKRPYQFSTPVVEGQRLYVGADAGIFYSIDSRKEKAIWEFKTEGPIQTKASLSEGMVYFGDTKAFLYALDQETGEERWRARLDTEIMATPLLVGNRVYAADMSGRLYAFDRTTGSEIWHTPSSDRNIGFSVRRSASPVYANGLIILGTSSGALIAYREGDGGVAWVRQLGSRQNQVYDVDSTPFVNGNLVYAASADNNLFCLDARNGSVLWQIEAGGVNDVIMHEGRIYATGNGVLSAIDPDSGDIFWQQDLETPEISSPAAGGHFIAVVSTKDKFYLVDSESGDVGYQRFVGAGSFGDPVIEGDRLYILSNKSGLYSFSVRELPAKKVKK